MFHKKFSFLTLCGCLLTMLSFTSCNNDEPSVPKVKMHITGIEIKNSDGRVTNRWSNFSYDEQGRIEKFYQNETRFEFEYTDDIIIRNKSNRYTYYCKVENGKIGNIGQDKYVYEQNNLVKYIEDGKFSYLYTWADGNVTKVYDTDGRQPTYLSYGKQPNYVGAFTDWFIVQTNLGYFDGVGDVQAFMPFLAQQGLFGNTTKNLLASIKNEDTDITISYEMNSNGYPTKMLAEENGKQWSITIEWE